IASNVDPAVFGGELHCIAEQVVENLLKANTIGVDWKCCFQLLLHCDIFGHGERTNCGQHFGQGLFDEKILTVKFQLPCFYFGEIENIVNQLQKMTSTITNMTNEARLLVCKRSSGLLSQQVRKSENGIQRSS